jgi:hypothetical protein
MQSKIALERSPMVRCSSEVGKPLMNQNAAPELKDRNIFPGPCSLVFPPVISSNPIKKFRAYVYVPATLKVDQRSDGAWSFCLDTDQLQSPSPHDEFLEAVLRTVKPNSG